MIGPSGPDPDPGPQRTCEDNSHYWCGYLSLEGHRHPLPLVFLVSFYKTTFLLVLQEPRAYSAYLFSRSHISTEH